MSPSFRRLTVQEFASILEQFPFTRRINAVHMHHTWRPNHSQYRGHDSIVAMWRHHTEVNGWSDIAQHLTIAPDGTIWMGRDWNRAPASAAGHNGNSTAGPFMFEMIGDFDPGRDRFEGQQRDVALQVIALLQGRFNLPPEMLRFHNQMSSKTCPGGAIDYNQIISDVRHLHAAPWGREVVAAAVGGGDGPFGPEALASRALIMPLSRELPARDDSHEAEPAEETMSGVQLHALFGLIESPLGSVAPGVTVPLTPPPTPSPVSSPLTPVQSVSSIPIVGRRRALCVGINQYPTAPLYGCVADAQTWETTLRALGFSDIVLLLEREATREAILKALSALVTTSTTGDVVVFQYAGHGTQLPDVNGDEAGGDTAQQDEAICPIDFAEGHFIIDDDIGTIFEQIPSGVNVTCFIDCCHSGTISRFGVGAASPTSTGRQGPHPRFIVATPQMIMAHRQFRQRHAISRSLRRRGLTGMQEVLFAACLSSEVAYENDGHGDFTVRATSVLQAGIDGVTNEQLEERIMTAFGAGPQQHPRLYCRPDAKSLRLLQPLVGTLAATTGAGTRNGMALQGVGGQTADTAQLLRLVASMLERRG